jgi:protein O-mannosyl-transferase
MGGRNATLIALLIAVTAALYWPSRGYQFVSWDDPDLVTENPGLVNPTTESLQAFWKEPYFGLYTPLSYSLWWVVAKANGGIEPVVFHTVNIVLHVAAAVLVYSILLRCTGWAVAAFGGALIFAVHPMQVESVAWVSGMNGVFSAVLGLAAIRLYMAHVDARPPRQWVYYALGTVVLIAALLAKPTAVVIPVMAAVVDLGMGRRRIEMVAAAVLPWVFIAIVFAVLAQIAQPSAATPIWQRPMIAGDAIGFYLGKFFCPSGLTIDYARKPGLVWQSREWMLTCGAVLGAAALAWGLWRRARGIGIGGLLVVAALLPTLGLVPFDFQRYSTVSDRYFYLAMLGPAWAISWGLAAKRNALWTGLVVVIGAILIVRSAQQMSHWHDTTELASYTLDRDSLSTMGNKIAAAELAKQNRWPEALKYYRAALIRNPQDADLHYNFANSLYYCGELDAAIDEYNAAIAIGGSRVKVRAQASLNTVNDLKAYLAARAKSTSRP